jgi:hypothetical protein
LRKPLENSYIRAENSSPEFNKTSIDGGLICANLSIPLEAGTALIKEFVLRTFGTANWTQFCPGMILGNPPRGQAEMMIGREIEFFCGLKWT